MHPEELPALLEDPAPRRGTVPAEATHAAPLVHVGERETRPGASHVGGLLTDKMHKLTSSTASLEADLRLALEWPITEFVLHYQPIVDLTSGEVVGVESLVRWQHPVRGLLGPDKFIALAEDLGLINQLGDWALDQAVLDVSRTRVGRELDVAINFSAQQLDDQVVTKVEHALANRGMRAGRLTVEVTESAFVRDEGITASTYAALSQMGVKFAIDDFGTSISSLLHLRRYPIDVLKIDGKFVGGIGKRAEDEALCESIIGLAGAVGASTVGEGVETSEQYAVLRSMGCQLGQGYLWSPAVPISQLDAAIATCEQVPVPERGSRLPRVVEGLSTEVTALIGRMHAEGASTDAIAAELNGTIGRHPSGVRWTAGAVARGLPAAHGSHGGTAEIPPSSQP